MPAAFSQAEINFFKALQANNVRFLIVGLSGAVLQGAPVVTEDIDIWIENLGSEQFLKAVQQAEGFYVPPNTAGQNPPMLGPQSLRLLDIVTTLSGLESFDSEYSKSVDITVGGMVLKVLPLAQIVKSKETANREKDRVVLPQLRSLLKSR